MDATNVTALVISVIALGLSGYFSWNQIRSMRQGNSVPVAIDLFANEFVRDEFQRLEITVIDEIGNHDASLGFAGLPEQLRAAAFNVALFYDSLGIFVAFDLIDEALVLSTRNYRIRRIWSVLEGHIRGERELRGAPFLDYLEDLAFRAHQQDPEKLARKIGLHQMPSAHTVKKQATREPSTPA